MTDQSQSQNNTSVSGEITLEMGTMSEKPEDCVSTVSTLPRYIEIESEKYQEREHSGASSTTPYSVYSTLEPWFTTADRSTPGWSRGGRGHILPTTELENGSNTGTKTEKDNAKKNRRCCAPFSSKDCSFRLGYILLLCFVLAVVGVIVALPWIIKFEESGRGQHASIY
ncbi:uncharacterized protein BDV14DRAFT_203279 [Aspergillus stella-maris]|uniref:uncharacterized protein n=1 Tax=Aspergillus stella-maris TaxID=1810926 RepID=UPI003CCCB3E7